MRTNGYGPDDDTPAESPEAKKIREIVRAQMVVFRSEMLNMVDAKLHALEGRLCEALVNSCSPKFMELDTRVSEVERRFDPQPSPPPSGAE